MTFSVTKVEPESINAHDMKDGDIGVITKWGRYGSGSVGKVIQRYKDILIALGSDSGQSYTSFFTGPTSASYQVMLIQRGDQLRFEGNSD